MGAAAAAREKVVGACVGGCGRLLGGRICVCMQVWAYRPTDEKRTD